MERDHAGTWRPRDLNANRLTTTEAFSADRSPQPQLPLPRYLPPSTQALWFPYLGLHTDSFRPTLLPAGFDDVTVDNVATSLPVHVGFPSIRHCGVGSCMPATTSRPTNICFVPNANACNVNAFI